MRVGQAIVYVEIATIYMVLPMKEELLHSG